MSAVDAGLGDAGDTGAAGATVAGAVADGGGVLRGALAADVLAALQQRIYAAAARLDVAALTGCVGEYADAARTSVPSVLQAAFGRAHVAASDSRGVRASCRDLRRLAEALPAWRHPTERMTALHAAVACAVRAVGKCVEDGGEGAAAAPEAAAAGRRRAGTAAERVEVDACRVVRLLASVVRCSSLAKPTGR